MIKAQLLQPRRDRANGAGPAAVNRRVSIPSSRCARDVLGSRPLCLGSPTRGDGQPLGQVDVIDNGKSRNRKAVKIQL